MKEFYFYIKNALCSPHQNLKKYRQGQKSLITHRKSSLITCSKLLKRFIIVVDVNLAFKILFMSSPYHNIIFHNIIFNIILIAAQFLLNIQLLFEVSDN